MSIIEHNIYASPATKHSDMCPDCRRHRHRYQLSDAITLKVRDGRTWLVRDGWGVCLPIEHQLVADDDTGDIQVVDKATGQPFDFDNKWEELPETVVERLANYDGPK